MSKLALDLDKAINDLLDILSSLDGRVKRLELKNQIKKRPSYLKVVTEDKSSILEGIRNEQVQNTVDLLNKAVNSISERIEKLEFTTTTKKEN